MDPDKIIWDILRNMKLVEELKTRYCEESRTYRYSDPEATIRKKRQIEEQFGLEIVAYQEGDSHEDS